MPTPKTFEEAIPLLDKTTAALAGNVPYGNGKPNWILSHDENGFFVSSWCMRSADEKKRDYKPTPLDAAIDFLDDSRLRIERIIAGHAQHVTAVLEESAVLARLLKE